MNKIMTRSDVMKGVIGEAKDLKKIIRETRFQLLPREKGIEAERDLQLSIRKTFDLVANFIQRARDLGIIDEHATSKPGGWIGDNAHIILRYDQRYQAVTTVLYRDPVEGSPNDEALDNHRYIFDAKKHFLSAIGSVYGPLKKNLYALSLPRDSEIDKEIAPLGHSVFTPNFDK